MLLSITEITETEVTFSNEVRTVTLPATSIDRFAHLSIGKAVEFSESDEVPYSISAQRRQDIRDHHAEEAACGNI